MKIRLENALKVLEFDFRKGAGTLEPASPNVPTAPSIKSCQISEVPIKCIFVTYSLIRYCPLLVLYCNLLRSSFAAVHIKTRAAPTIIFIIDNLTLFSINPLVVFSIKPQKKCQSVFPKVKDDVFKRLVLSTTQR